MSFYVKLGEGKSLCKHQHSVGSLSFADRPAALFGAGLQGKEGPVRLTAFTGVNKKLVFRDSCIRESYVETTKKQIGKNCSQDDGGPF